MATFILTARYTIYKPGWLYIEKGQQYTININMMGVTPTSLFSNSRYKDAVIQQFRMNGIVVPSSDISIYSLGAWDVKRQ